MRRRGWWCGLGTIITLGCGGGDTTEVSPPPAAVAVSVSGVPELLLVGVSVSLQAVARSASGTTIGNATVSWVSRDPTVVEVSAMGVVTARAAGITRIVATVGAVADSATVYSAFGAPAELRVVAGDKPAGVVGSAITDLPRFQLVDAQGRGVPGVMLTFSDQAPGAVIQPASVRTDAQGRAALTLWTLGTRAGPEQVQALASTGNAAVVPAVVSAGAAARVVVVSGDGQDGNMRSALSATIVLRVTDAYGNPSANALVAAAADDGSGVLAPFGPRTDNAGLAQLVWTMPSRTGPVSGRATIESLPAVAVSAYATGFRAKSVYAGDGYTCAIDLDDRGWCWGGNGSSQRTGTNTQLVNKPVPMETNLQWLSLSIGHASACGIATDHRAYCWGANAGSFLGAGPGVSSSAFPIPVALSATFEQIDVEYYTACGITTSHDAYCWGDNWMGQLGAGLPTTTSSSSTPVRVLLPEPATEIRAPCAIGVSGTAYCWGVARDLRFQTPLTVPRAIQGAVKFKSLSSGDWTCGITVAAAVHCWDWVADPDWVQVHLIPGPSTDAAPALAGRVASIDKNWCILSTEGRVYCRTTWYGDFIQQFDDGFRATAVSQGSGHTCILGERRQVYCWGYGGTGALGNGVYKDASIPTLVVP